MNRTYPCIGGPLDGAARACDGCPDLYVAVADRLTVDFMRSAYPGADQQIPVNNTMKRHHYQLCEVPGVGLAWMHKP